MAYLDSTPSAIYSCLLDNLVICTILLRQLRRCHQNLNDDAPQTPGKLALSSHHPQDREASWRRDKPTRLIVHIYVHRQGHTAREVLGRGHHCRQTLVLALPESHRGNDPD